MAAANPNIPRQNFLNESTRKPDFAFPTNLWSDKQGVPFVNFRVVPPFADIRTGMFNIALFMPPSMRISYNSVWEEIDLWTANQVAVNVVQDNYQKQGEFGSAVRDTMQSWGITTIGSDMTGLNANAIFQKASRMAVNPHASMMFKNMAFREFKLDWMLFPKNEADTQSIKDIIFQFKYAMHPGGTTNTGTFNNAALSNFLGIPENFIISFYAPHVKSLVKTHPCALISCDVEYNAAGVPAYMKNNRPACISLTLHFKECAIITKENIEQGW
jgi:hypothetical protein